MAQYRQSFGGYLDGASAPCSSPVHLRTVAAGPHAFAVAAIAPGGSASAHAHWRRTG